MSPYEVIEIAKKFKLEGIAFTYNEPLIYIKFAKDCGLEAHKNSFFNIFVSNCYLTPESIGMTKIFGLYNC
jgi:pyruvate formate lyase activating enzyme